MSGIDSALVSLWSSPDSVKEEHFLCSGAFVHEALVLTVKHVFDKRSADQVWVRPERAEAKQAFKIAEVVKLHPERDAALLRIEAMPGKATWLALDCGAKHDPAENAYALHGYFEGRCENPVGRTVLAFDPGSNWYLTSPRHPKGYSGAPLVRQGRIWGMATEHYVAATADRGCVLGMHQLLAGFQEHLPVAPPPSAAAPGPQRDKLIRLISDELKRAFAKPGWAQQTTVPLQESLPRPVYDALARDEPSEQGRACVFAVLEITKALGQALRNQDVVVNAVQRGAMHDSLMAAMDAAARLCLNPDGCVSNEQMILLVPADTDEGGALAVRDRPLSSLVPGDVHGLATVTDRNKINACIEMGVGADAVHDVARLAFASLSPTAAVPKVVTDDMLLRLRGRLHDEADEGRARILVLRGQDLQKFDEPTQKALKHLGLQLMGLTGNDGRLFLFDEPLLLGKLHNFVKQLDKPEWKQA